MSMADSKLEHVPSSSNNQGNPDLITHSAATVNHIQAPAIPVDPDFAYSDGNIEFQTSTLRLWIHEFQLVKFARISELIRQARDQGEITAGPERRVKVRIPGTESLRSADFRNTFRVLYSDVVSAPSSPRFDETALISTLRVATLYQNPGLRSFAITQLQFGLVLSPIHRIRLSDELSLPDWEFAAFAELCRRPEPISQKEAKTLGVTRFVEIARIREAEQRRQYVGLIGRATANPFLNADGTVKQDKLQTEAKQTLAQRHAPPPICDFRPQSYDTVPYYGGSPVVVRKSSDYPPRKVVPKPPSVDTREIHRLAPRLASESYTLYKHLFDALGRLGALTRYISTTTRGLPGSDKEYSVENELKRANWVRKAK